MLWWGMPFLAPARAQLARLRAMAGRSSSADAAWLTLVARGALPASWLDDPRRRFVHDPSNETRDPAFVPRGPHPDRVEGCMLIAADVPGVLAAEAAARTLAERLAIWGAPSFEFALWWILSRRRYGRATTDTRPGGHYALLFAMNALSRSLGDTPHPRRLFGEAARWSELWRAQAAADARIAADDRTRAAGLAFAALPDPFEPLAAIEENGYGSLEWIGGGSARGAVVLVCPDD